MSQPFSFPPPPPPPPKRDYVPSQHAQPYPSSNYGRGRGRGNFDGRGSYGQRGSYSRGGGRGFNGPSIRGNHGSQTYAPRGTLNSKPPYEQKNVNLDRVPHPHSPASNPLKRDHESAFIRNNTKQNVKPKAPPAVPSFNIDIASLLPGKAAQTISKPAPSRKGNSLGLTPQNDDSESESNGEDEEAKLTATLNSGSISFEHRGQKLALSTAADIAAWIAERRSKFPTQVKAEAAKKIADDKKRAWQEQKQASIEAAKLRNKQREEERREQEMKKLKEKLIAAQVQKSKAAVANTKKDPAEKARQKAEKLRKKLEKANEQLRAAEAALQQAHEQKQHGSHAEVIEHNTSAKDGSIDSASVSAADDTSSSGTSDSDDETDSSAAPEESSSKKDGPERIPPPPRTIQPQEKGICRTLAKTGSCKYGKRCRFSHDIPSRSKNTSAKTIVAPVRRKGLYEIMVAQEEEEARKNALRVIIALGEQGLLKDGDPDTQPQIGDKVG